MLLLEKKKGKWIRRRLRKIEVPADTPPEFELGTQCQIEAQKQRKEAMREESTHSAEAGVAEKRARTDKSDTEIDTGGGIEVGTFHLPSWHKKGHMTNIYLTDSNEEAIGDLVKDHEESYDKTNEHFKEKVRKTCLWKRFANSRKLSVKVCKTWFESQRTCYGKLTQSKAGEAPKERMERQNWIQDKLNCLKMYIRHKGLSKMSGFFNFPVRGVSALAASEHNISRGSTDMDSMEISMQSGIAIQSSVTSASAVSVHSSVDQQVMDQFAQMKTMLSSFHGPKQERKRTAFYIYLVSEVKAFEE